MIPLEIDKLANGKNWNMETLDRLKAGWPECGCVSTAPASKWDFGTVVGNCVQGAELERE